MDARQAIKSKLAELREALKHLDVDGEDVADAVVRVLKDDAHDYFEISDYYNTRGYEHHKARMIERVAKAKAAVAGIHQLAQRAGIDVAGELAAAAQQIREKVSAAGAAIREAAELAKEHGIPFSSSANGVRNTFDPDDGWEHSAIC